MAYKPRMSIIPQQQQRQRQQRREPSPDTIILTDREVVEVIAEFGIQGFTIQNLLKPSPTQIQAFWEAVAELLLNVTRETVDPAMRAAAEEVCGDYADIVPTETRNLMAFYGAVRGLMRDCGVDDFSFNDLYRPTYDRVVKLVSYLLNYVRFREARTKVIDYHFNQSQRIRMRIEELYVDNEKKVQELAQKKRERKEREVEVKEKQDRHEELKRLLFDLKKAQEKIVQSMEDAKLQKQELAKELEAKITTKLMMQKDAAKLRPYASKSPAALQENLADLNNTLTNDKMHIDALDRRARALQTSIDSFTVVSADVASCIKMLGDIGAELSREEEENVRHSRQRDILTQRGHESREMDRKLAQMQSRHAKAQQRLENLLETAEARARQATATMEELRVTHKRLSEERTEKAKDIERRKVRIEQTEKKMLDLKENIEMEVHAAYDEYLKMEAHIKLYITEMEQAI